MKNQMEVIEWVSTLTCLKILFRYEVALTVCISLWMLTLNTASYRWHECKYQVDGDVYQTDSFLLQQVFLTQEIRFLLFLFLFLVYHLVAVCFNISMGSNSCKPK